MSQESNKIEIDKNDRLTANGRTLVNAHKVEKYIQSKLYKFNSAKELA